MRLFFIISRLKKRQDLDRRELEALREGRILGMPLQLQGSHRFAHIKLI